IAIVRPGPIQGGMVHPYLRRRQGLEAVDYPSQEIKSVLERTLGIPVFQEQVIRLAMVAAGFSGGQADQLRRAMASSGKSGSSSGNNPTLAHFEQKLTDGMVVRGYSLDFAERLYKQIQGFGVYGFPESHSASFALLAYVSAWLKCHHPAAFCCALLNSQPMGFYSPSQLLQDAQRHQIEIRPIDVCHSSWDHSLETNSLETNSLETNSLETNSLETNSLETSSPETNSLETGSSAEPAIRLGLCLIKGLSHQTAQRIASAQRNSQQGFNGLAQLSRAAGLSQADLALLSSAGALRSLTSNRRQAYWDALAIEDYRPLLESAQDSDSLPAILSTPSEVEELNADYSSTGVSLGRHPMAILREQSKTLQRCKRTIDLPTMGNRRFVRIAGLVTGRQRPGTASGVIFLTLEDETGNSNIVVWTRVQERCREALLKGHLLMVKGVVETDGNVVHVIAQELTDCSSLMAEL
ncbi:OB-fold nucleic acid binding domain-containing protein, partial [Porticoccaceae bacterium]|nr:OB-fold nucleic acid binding domain-containing protein [Porticoccaceae bacterium]